MSHSLVAHLSTHSSAPIARPAKNKPRGCIASKEVKAIELFPYLRSRSSSPSAYSRTSSGIDELIWNASSSNPAVDHCKTMFQVEDMRSETDDTYVAGFDVNNLLTGDGSSSIYSRMTDESREGDNEVLKMATAMLYDEVVNAALPGHQDRDSDVNTLVAYSDCEGNMQGKQHQTMHARTNFFRKNPGECEEAITPLSSFDRARDNIFPPNLRRRDEWHTDHQRKESKHPKRPKHLEQPKQEKREKQSKRSRCRKGMKTAIEFALHIGKHYLRTLSRRKY